MEPPHPTRAPWDALPDVLIHPAIPVVKRRVGQRGRTTAGTGAVAMDVAMLVVLGIALFRR